MEAFSYQEFPFLADCVLPPDMMMTLSSSSPASTNTSPLLSPSCCFPEEQQPPHLLNSNSSYSEPIFHGEQLQFQYPFENSQDPTELSLHERSCLGQGTPLPFAQSTPLTPKQNWAPLNNTGKPEGDGSSQNPCKGLRGGRRKKLRKSKNSGGVNEEQQQQNKTQSPYPTAAQEAPAGYIHVRARRGQATDSHSLAERARREKISDRMKLLQALVPGCDKVTGKATMLDEIIHYVRSLQTQVNFLSMKLTSMNPMVYNFGVDLDALLFGQQTSNNTAPPTGSLQQSTADPNNETSSISVATAVETTGYQQGQRGANPSYLDQDNGIGSLDWGLGGQGGPDPINQPGFSVNNNIMY